jgi:hypothetical protein
MSGAPMSGAPTSGYPQGWPTYQAPVPAQREAGLDEHGLPAYPGGAQHFPVTPPAADDNDEPSRGGA